MHGRLFLAVLLGCSVWLVAGSALGWQNSGQAPRIRVLAWHIKYGSTAENRIDLPRIAEKIKEIDPDIAVLAAIDHKTRRSGGVAQTEELAHLTQLDGIFAPAMDYNGGMYGNAVLYKPQLRQHKNHRLPAEASWEPRTALELEFAWPTANDRLIVLASQFDNRSQTSRTLAAERVNQLILQRPDVPAIFAGDTACTPGNVSMRPLNREWATATNPPLRTFPPEKPEFQYDHILMRPKQRWKVVEAKVHNDVQIGHLPLEATLELLPR